MRPVIGTAGHIDHGKTTLLRALTGIDADRLPEERRRGMTIDVGYAHLALPDGTTIDFVDVPGHDRLVGNMLVGAGEIDAAMLVVAADDGPRAQTLEHLELLDALGISAGIAVVTKIDLVTDARRAEVTEAIKELLAGTSLAGSPIHAVAGTTGEGIGPLRAALTELAARVRGVAALRPVRPTTMAADRVFNVRGRGIVVTGTLRGEPIEQGALLRAIPGDAVVRVREVQVHGEPLDRAQPGRTALNVVVAGSAGLHRGMVLARGDVVETDRLLVALRRPAPLRTAAAAFPRHGARLRLHLGTDQVDAVVSLGGREGRDLPGTEAAALLRLGRPIAVGVGDRFVLRRAEAGETAAGGRVLDPDPPRGVARRRVAGERLSVLASAVGPPVDRPAALRALVDLHGALPVTHLAALGLLTGDELRAGPLVLARDVFSVAASEAATAVTRYHDDHPLETGMPLAALRAVVAEQLRRATGGSGATRAAAAAAFVDALVAAGRLARDGDRVHLPGRTPTLPTHVTEAMDRLEALLAVPAPPPLDDAAQASGCPPEGVRALLAAGRLVRLSEGVVYAASALARLEATAIRLAAEGPLTPAAFRDATGTSRKYVLAILEDLDRRGVLRRTDAGHVPGQRSTSVGSRIP